MPTRPRSLLLALAFAATVFACAGAAPPAGGVRNAKPPVLLGPPTPRHVARAVVRKRTLGERAARIALKEVGVPYRWGGTSPTSGFDCSGLVSWAYGRLGIALPHSSYALAGAGRRVGRSHLKPGDLLFFYGFGHVGVYVGRGRMVHAPHSGALVEVVRLARSDYGSRLVSARRIAHS